MMAMKCTARTKAGKRCKAYATQGMKRCIFHARSDVKEAYRFQRRIRRTKYRRK